MNQPLQGLMLSTIVWQPMNQIVLGNDAILLLLPKPLLGSRIHPGVYHPNGQRVGSVFLFDLKKDEWPIAWAKMPFLP